MRNKVLIFGDSITYGQRDLELGGWTNRLKLVITSDSSIAGCHVFNMGIPGQTTGEVLERLDRECAGRALELTNNIIILAAGINDTQIINGKVRVSEDDFRDNVNILIDYARSHTDKVIYVGLTPVDESRTNPVFWDRKKNWRNDVVERYDEIIREVCSEQDVRYIYMFDKVDPLTNQDGLHPSAEGHWIMTEIIAEAVYEYLMPASPLAGMAGAAKGPAKTKRK